MKDLNCNTDNDNDSVKSESNTSNEDKDSVRNDYSMYRAGNNISIKRLRSSTTTKETMALITTTFSSKRMKITMSYTSFKTTRTTMITIYTTLKTGKH